MDLDALQRFLAQVGHQRFVDYARQYGATPIEGLENRVAWAWRMRRSPPHLEEARFLIDHENPLRTLCHETAAGVGDDAWDGWEDEESTHAASADEILDIQIEAHRRAATTPRAPDDTGWDDWEDDQEATVVISTEALLGSPVAAMARTVTREAQKPAEDDWEDWADEESTIIAQPEDFVALRRTAEKRASRPVWQPATRCATCDASLEGVTAFWHADKRWRCRACFRTGR